MVVATPSRFELASIAPRRFEGAQGDTMNRKMCWVVRGVFVLSAMLVLTVGVVQAQTSGQIAKFNQNPGQ